MNEQTSQRFAAKVAPRGAAGCMLWQGATNGEGYGQLRVDGRLQKAHRLSYEHWVEPIPDGLVIDHLCRNRACVAPEHLRVVTRRENTLAEGSEALAAVEVARTHCPRGHELTAGNLVPSLVRRGWRNCLVCSRARSAAVHAARRATCEAFGITTRQFTAGRYSLTDIYRATYAAAKEPEGGA